MVKAATLVFALVGGARAGGLGGIGGIYRSLIAFWYLPRRYAFVNGVSIVLTKEARA